MKPRTWLTIEQARRRASVSRRTIYNWLARGLLRTTTVPSGAIRIDVQSLWRRPRTTPVRRRPLPIGDLPRRVVYPYVPRVGFTVTVDKAPSPSRRRARQHLEVLAGALGITVQDLKRLGAEDVKRRRLAAGTKWSVAA
jgi:hypothetical protein